MSTPLPPAGRALARTVTSAVTCAAGQDPDGLRDATATLSAADEHVVREVLSALVLRLLERTSPDGLDADSVRDLLAEVLREAAGWLPELDPHAVVLVLSGALAVHEQDESAADWSGLLLACALVLARLLDRGGVPLGPELDAALGELRRAQTVELP